MLTCYECGKIIKGRAVLTNPPNYFIRLGIDFPKAFHPVCRKREQAAALRNFIATEQRDSK